ncbi:unnamed protein product [Ixodes hexagonus]
MEGRRGGGDHGATGADRWGDSLDPIDLGAGGFLTAFSSSGWGSGVSDSGLPRQHALRRAGRQTNIEAPPSRALQSTMPSLFPALRVYDNAALCMPLRLQRVLGTCMDAGSRDIDVTR